MNIQRLLSISLVLSLLLACTFDIANADRGPRIDRRGPDRHAHEKGYVLDTRHRHNHYYPPRGYVVRSLPARHRTVWHNKVPYYFADGIWYRSSGVSFSVVLPPVGLVVPVLPPYYTTVWAGSVPYYYADGTYYSWQPARRGYVVTESPPEREIVETPDIPNQLFIYPAQGQTSEQQATDRYECHSWASDQSGFDPTRPGGNVPERDNANRRSDYQRAMKACLEARGYSVQ